MSGFEHAEAYLDLGWTPFPLPHGKKHPPPNGVTGRGAREVSVPDIYSWLETDRDANIGIRCPAGVIGVDIDAYKATAQETMATLQALAPMPATWCSTSKDDGSGIYFYRVPVGATDEMRDPGPGVETIRPEHRYFVAAPSLHPSGATYRWISPIDGSNTPPRVDQLPELPAAWLEHMTHRVAKIEFDVAEEAPDKPEKPSRYEETAVRGVLDRLDAMRKAATTDGSQYRGEPWDQTTHYAACRLLELANASWTALKRSDVADLVLAHAPRDVGFNEARIREKITSAQRSVGTKAAPMPANMVTKAEVETWMAASVTNASPAPAASAPSSEPAVAPQRQTILHDRTVDVSLKAEAARWLRGEVGRGPLSGIFYRKGELVYTPRIGEEGYIEARTTIAEGAASITPMSEHDLQARVQTRYDVIRLVEDPPHSGVFKRRPEIFPLESAKVVVRAADECPELRTLEGVIHSPALRPDGSIIHQAGYDAATGLLLLPTGRQPGPIPDNPTREHLEIARSWINYMLQDFKFVTVDDRATYLGLMLTPLLRTLVPPPYKLGIIEAHQPGSGKTFLARAIISLYGGLEHAELPDDEPELQKLIGTILDTQTSPVVVFDNVSGVVRSSTLAGLLTSPVFQARRLGSSTTIEANNDRLWLMTGNNAQLGGDLARRNVRVRIDPGVPNPENLTHFAIANFEQWVRDHRGELLWSLLVMARAWVVQGMPYTGEPTKDSYGTWTATVRGILATAGQPGTFDGIKAEGSALDVDTEEWATFLEHVVEHFRDQPWTTKQLLAKVAHPAMPAGGDPLRPIPFDALPGSLTLGRAVMDPSSLSTSLGRWLMNREGRWYNNLCVNRGGAKTKLGVPWVVNRYGE